MEKKIRSISISESIDEQLIEDSRYRGLTISANLTRILYEYFQSQPLKTGNVLSVKRK
tara:strand:+ start:472 stop:645 length:174 start_codon:yes stop_codon:yes gene_type:complete